MLTAKTGMMGEYQSRNINIQLKWPLKISRSNKILIGSSHFYCLKEKKKKKMHLQALTKLSCKEEMTHLDLALPTSNYWVLNYKGFCGNRFALTSGWHETTMGILHNRILIAYMRLKQEAICLYCRFCWAMKTMTLNWKKSTSSLFTCLKSLISS